MKTFRKIFWLVILGMLLFGGIMAMISVIQDDAIAREMNDLDVSSAKGSLVIGYNLDEGKYTASYVPKDLLAKKKEDVGYILKLSFKKTGASYSGGHFVSGTAIHAQLVDCDTGKIIDEANFEPYFPQTVSSKTKSISVDSSRVLNWVTDVYPSDVESHVWQEATCIEPKTCTDCGATEGNPLGHNFMPDVCTRCGMEIPAQKQEETTEPQTEPAAPSPKETAESVIPGRWNLDYLMDTVNYDIIPYDSEFTFQINKDHSAFITASGEKYAYTWEFQYDFLEDYDSNILIYYYTLTDDAGNTIYFIYYPDDSIGLFTDEYSVFFVR